MYRERERAQAQGQLSLNPNLKTKMTKAQVRHRFGGPFQRKQLTVSPAPRLVRRSCSSRGRLMRTT